MSFVIRNARLLDGSGAAPVGDATVVVSGDKIAYAGPADGATSPPSDARIIDAAGRTVMPGLIDAHAHMLAYPNDMEERLTTHATLIAFRTMRNLRITLEAGVTTVRDGGGIDAGYRIAVEQGLIPGPRLFVAGNGLAPTGALFDLHWGSGVRVDLSGASTLNRRFVDGVDDVRKAVRQLVLAGVDHVKIVSTGSIFAPTGFPPRAQYSPDELTAIVQEAHAAGKKVMCHAEGGPGVMNALRAGVDSIEHGFGLDDASLELMIKRGTYLCPTLFPLHRVERNKRVLSDPDYQGFQRALAAGVKIAMGSDIFYSHGRNALELEYMVTYGMTPMQAIVAACRTSAELLDIASRTGKLAAGFDADLLIIDGDPLADIRVLQDGSRIQLVMREGRVYKDALGGA
jgi:imidazolonepropionase-like amidohydrolase